MRPVRVALELRVAADDDPADLAGRQLVPLVVDDAQLGAADRPPGGVRGDPQVGGDGHADLAGLGGVVAVVHDVAEPVHEAHQRLRPHPRAAGGDEAQRRRVVAVQHLVGQLDDPLQHHGYDGQAGRAVPLDECQRGLRVEPAAHHQRAGHRGGDRQLAEAPGVEHRRGHHGDLAGPPGDPVEHRGQLVGASATAASTLRRTRGARGQQHGAAVARGTGRRRPQVRLDESVDGGLLLAVLGPGDHLDELGEPVARRAEEVGELLVVDEHLRALALQDVGQLRCGEAGVEQQRVGPEPRAGAEGLDEPAVVAAQDADGLRRAVRDGGGETDGQGGASLLELGPGQ